MWVPALVVLGRVKLRTSSPAPLGSSPVSTGEVSNSRFAAWLGASPFTVTVTLVPGAADAGETPIWSTRSAPPALSSVSPLAFAVRASTTALPRRLGW